MSSTLLLADDSLTIQKVVELTFADTDFGVVAVSSGDELLRQIPLCQPDAVICDVIMPGKDGYQVCQEIKSNPAWLHIPVILLTGTFEPFDRDRALAAGCSEVITKPFEARKLVETVERLVQSAAESTQDADDSAIAGSFTPSWSDADRPSSGGFQPLETPEVEDDFDFGTRLSMQSPEIAQAQPVEPVQPPPEAEDRWPAETLEPEPAAAAPIDEPVLEPQDFAEVELTGEGDETSEGYETTELDDGDFEHGSDEEAEGEFESAGSFEPEVEGVQEPEAEPEAEPEIEPEPEPATEAPREPEVEPFAAAPPSPPSLPARPPAPALVRAEAGVGEPFTADDSGIGAAREPLPAPETATAAQAPVMLSDEDVERIARKVLELSSGTLERMAWEVLPDMAELVVRERVRQLEAAVDGAAPAEEPQ